MKPIKIANLNDLEIEKPTHALVRNTDLVLIRYGEEDVSVLYGRCLHRGALLADGEVVGDGVAITGGVLGRVDYNLARYDTLACGGYR